MKIDHLDDTILFETTGRKEYANCGIIGIHPDRGVSEGYDGGLDDDKWTPEEKRELAEYMIEQWKLFGGIS